MSRYECPDCGGGFHEVPPEQECPWCGYLMNGEKQRGPFDPAQSVITPSSDGLDVTPGPDVDDGIGLTADNTSTTPCPECGDPMPMVTWHGEKPLCQKCARDRGGVLGVDTQ